MTKTEAERTLDAAFATAQELPIPEGKDRGRKPPATGGGPARAPLPTWREGAIAEWTEKAYVALGEMVSPFDEAFGTAMVTIAEPAGRTWEKIAKQNINVRRWFARLMQGSAVTELLMVHMPLFMVVIARVNPMRSSVERMATEFEKEFSEVVSNGNPPAGV